MLAKVQARLEALIDWETRSRGPVGGATVGGTQGGGMRVTVEPAADLLARLGDPERAFRVVHIAGTKGKGSVAALVAGALEAEGIRTGVFASPHVERLNERVRIGGAEIGDEELATALEQALDAQDAARVEGTPASAASWFDVLTAAAMLAFQRACVEWAVVECGLGGRLDSTNALTGEVCVITNIDLEHTDVLGETLAEIAAEKAGILDRGTSLVTAVPSQSEAGRVIDARAEALGVCVHRPEIAGLDIRGENRALAASVLAALGSLGVEGAAGRALDGAFSSAVLKSSQLPGRLEVRELEGVRVILDGAHVASSLERVLGDLEGAELLSGSPVICIFGTGADKQLEALLKVLVGRVDRLVCTSVGTRPVRSPREIQEVASGLLLAVETAVGPRVALQRALELAKPDGIILVTGSLHLIGAVRPLLSPTDSC